MTTGDEGGRRWRRWSRREAVLGGLSLAGLVGALAAGFSLATDSVARAAESFGAGHRGWHARERGFDPDDAAFFADWMLHRVDATEDQRARVRPIVESAASALAALHGQHRANRDAIAAALTAETVDRVALEQLRQQEVALMDQASRRVTDDLAAIAEVLTPEQRQALVEMARRHHGPRP